MFNWKKRDCSRVTCCEGVRGLKILHQDAVDTCYLHLLLWVTAHSVTWFSLSRRNLFLPSLKEFLPS